MPSALLLVDVQRNMLDPPEPVAEAQDVATVIGGLLARARSAGALIVHSRNNGGPDDPDAPGTAGWELAIGVLPGEHIVEEDVDDAFTETPLAKLLPPDANLVLVGMQSQYCVRATALAARQRGYQTSLVAGGHATYDEELPAREISHSVERELEIAGVRVLEPGSVSFGGMNRWGAT